MKKQTTKALTILAISFFFFFLLSNVLNSTAVASLDSTLQATLFSLRCNPLHFFFIPLTYSGNWQSVIAIAFLLLLLPTTRKKYGVPMATSALFSVSVYEFLKPLFARSRPEPALHLISQGGFSFPSGHALTALVFWGTFLLLFQYYRTKALKNTSPNEKLSLKKRTTLFSGFAVCYIVLVGISRIYVGVHWPTDVLGSWCLGLGLLSIIRLLLPHYLHHFHL